MALDSWESIFRNRAGIAREREPSPLLILVAGLALFPRLLDALCRPIDYNGYWHLFIARNLSREWPNLQHPPLFLLFLRAVDSVSHATLAYRSISLLAGVGAVYLVGRVLAKLECLAAVQVLGALAAAFAFNAITLSNEVESYSLCVLFLLGALLFYLNLVRVGPSPSRGSRIGFASLACLALASHYFSGLFLIACVLAPVIAAAFRPGYRRALRVALPRRWRADLMTLLPPLLVGLLLYELQAKRWVMPLSSLPAFYYNPEAERVINFVVRNLRETFNLFAPFVLPRARYALPLLAVFVLTVVWAVAAEKPADTGSVTRLMPALFLVLLLLIGMALGIAGRYPFGGMMRHQFLFFLFALLSGFVAFDRLLRTIRSPSWRRALVALCVGAIGINFAVRLPRLAHPAPDRLRPIVEGFSKEFLNSRTITVDQFNLVGLFGVYHDWTWRFQGRESPSYFVERYELSKGPRKLVLLALRDWWIFDFRSDALYRELAGVWKHKDQACYPILCIYGTIFDKPARQRFSNPQRAGFDTRLRALASKNGLKVQKLLLTDYLDLYSELCMDR